MDRHISFDRWRLLGDKMFLESDLSSYTYAEAASFISRAAVFLQRELPSEQDIVPLLLDNSTEFVLTVLAVMAASRTPYPIQPNCKPAEYESKVWGISSSILIADSGSEPLVTRLGVRSIQLSQLIEAAQDGTADSDAPGGILGEMKLICGTSGTTERPKKVVLQLSHIIANAKAHADSIGLTTDDKVLSCLPFYHGFTLLTHLFSVLALEAGFIAGRDSSPKAVATLIAKFGATYTSFVPALLDSIMRNFDYQLFDSPTLKRVSVGSAPVSEKQVKNYRRFFANQRLYVTYGQTEAGPRISTLDVNGSSENVWDTVGAPLAHTEVRVANADTNGIGELQVRAAWQMLGYYGEPDASDVLFTADGWLQTGDLAKLVDDKYIRMCGRKKDLIISGGVNVSPVEIETILNTISWIDESMVIAVPDERRGEVAHAFVVASSEQTCTIIGSKQIMDVLKGRLDLIKIPKKIHFVSRLPKNPIGKPDRKALLKKYIESIASTA